MLTLLNSLDHSLYIMWHYLFPMGILILLLDLAITACRKIGWLPWEAKQGLRMMFEENAEGFLFGKKLFFLACSPSKGEGHILTVGGSGTGKTSALLVPSLRRWRGTFFAIDISGDIERNCSEYVPDRIIYDPDDPEAEPYNVFGEIDKCRDNDSKIVALEKLAHLLVPEVGEKGTGSRYYIDEGRRILTACLLSGYFAGKDFIEICEDIVSTEWRTLFAKIDSGQCDPAKKIITSYVNGDDKIISQCKAEAAKAVELFVVNPFVRRSMRRPVQGERCYTPSVLEDCSVFIRIGIDKISVYKPLLHLITAQTLEYFNARKVTADSKTVLLALDEFSNLGELEITSALQVMRKRKLRIAIFIQSISDLDSNYGTNDRKSMLDNFAFKVILSATEVETQEYFSKLIGYKTVKKTSYTSGGDHSTRTITEEKVPAVEPAELAHLKNNLILIHPDGWVQLKKNFYFK